jgi:hypothetical protein
MMQVPGWCSNKQKQHIKQSESNIPITAQQLLQPAVQAETTQSSTLTT